MRRLTSSGALQAVLATSAYQLVGLMLTLLVGVALARGLGDGGRGEYAIVVTWYGIVAMLAEWGQSAAVTFSVARNPGRVAAIVASSRAVMLLPSAIVAVIGLGTCGILSSGDGGFSTSIAIAFLMPLLSALAAPHLYAAQAISIRSWNTLRLLQPVAYLGLVMAAVVLHRVSVLTATVCLAGSLGIQMLAAYAFGRSHAISGSRFKRSLMAPLASFGARQLSSAVPASLSSSLDKLVLAVHAGSAVVGHYAVGLAVMSVSGMVGSAVSAVSFPRLAGLPRDSPGRPRIELRSLVGTGLGTLVLAASIASVSPWAIPTVYGRDFAEAIELVWWFIPALVLSSLNLVAGAIVRARARPGGVAIAQVIGLLATGTLLLAVVPALGATGAAGSIATGSFCTFAMLLVIWWRDCIAGRSESSLAPFGLDISNPVAAVESPAEAARNSRHCSLGRARGGQVEE